MASHGEWTRLRFNRGSGTNRESVKLTGAKDTGNWQNPAFHRLVEAMVVTAVHRAAEHWRP